MELYLINLFGSQWVDLMKNYLPRWLWLLVKTKKKKFKIGYINKAHYFYKKHSNNMSSNQIKKSNKNLCIIKKYFMTILVTGSSGFIGSNLVKYLQKEKKFVGIDKTINLILNLVPIKVDLKNKSKVEKIIRKKILKV